MLLSILKTVGIGVAGLTMLALIVWGVIHGGEAQAAWEANCKAQGGHIDKVSKTNTGTGIGSNGKPVVTTSTETTYYCLTADGRILDIR